MPPRKKAATLRAALESTSRNSNQKRPLEQNSEDAPTAKRPRAPKTTAAVGDCPDWAYDVEGLWEIEASELSHDVAGFEREYPVKDPPFTMHIKYTNNPRKKKIGRQLWATFTWGKMNGIIRMCPGHKYRTSHLDFYDNCVLQRGVWAGPSPQGKPIWNFRWRAGYGDEGLFENSGSATDEFETQIEFSKDSNGKMKLAGKMVVGGYKARKFTGLKTDQQPPTGNEKTLEELWDSLQDPYEEDREEICRGCKGAVDDSSEEETDIEWEERWKARDAAREAEKAREEEEEKQPWSTDITGEWEITPRRPQKDETTPGSMNIYYEDGHAAGGCRQYYANFKISPDWHGTMRFCPVGVLDTGKDIELADFEKACILKDDVKAGPPPGGVHEWMVKWRGVLNHNDMPSENKPCPHDQYTTSITFKKGEEGKMVLSFILVKNGPSGGLIEGFKGVRIGDGKPRGPIDPTIEQLWDEKKFVSPPPPPAPKLWPWKSPLLTPNIEAPPPWAWDVLGKWEISAHHLAQALEIEEGASMLMTIRLANDPKNKKIGRQLWATFDFGSNVSGCMRFCPLPEKSKIAKSVAQFEKQCVLKKGVWPGDSASKPGKSFQKWGYRWRAEDRRGESLSSSDSVEHMFNFKRDEDGTLKLSGVFGAIWQCVPWSAVKVQDGDPAEDLDVNTKWMEFVSSSEGSD